MLSHQNLADMRLALDPKFRFVISRAIYKGMLRFIHEQDNTPYIVQPLPVEAFAIQRTGNDSLKLIWKPTADPLEPTAQPDYYILYTRKEGGDWDNGVRIETNGREASTHKTVRIVYNRRYDFRIAAGNKGGISLMSRTLSACIVPNSKLNALVINGFNRVSAPDMVNADSLTGGIVPGSYAIPYGVDVTYIGDQYDYDRHHEWINDDECGFGMSYSDYSHTVTVGNTFDYPSLYADVMRSHGMSYVSASDNMADETSGDNDLIVLIKGKQKNDSTYFSPSLRTLIGSHLQKGGKLLMSGSYIASGLVTKEDRTFAADKLHYRFYSSKASHIGEIYTLAPVMPVSVYRFATAPNDSIICCESPDGITPTAVSQRLARYKDSGVCAGVVYKNQIIVLPFMLESVTDFNRLAGSCMRCLFSPQ